jgi:dienelactone hydrolase
LKRILKITAIAIVVLVVAAWVGLWAWGNSRHASAAPEALAALASDANVIVEQDRYLVFRPAQAEPQFGVILYPGANCDVRGYAPLLRRIAAAGYLVVAVPMPLEFAVLAPNRALDVQAAYPAIGRWALIGHSLGGAMAATFIDGHRDAVAGLVIWDSYPPEANSLADWKHPVWHIHRATVDGGLPPGFEARRPLFPPDSHWVAVPGGIHMYFGSFEGGGFQETWEPSIPRSLQQDITVAATLEGLAAMGGPSPGPG